MKYQYLITGRPVPLQRPRFTRGHTYDPQKKQKQLHIEELINQCIPKEPLSNPITIKVEFFFKYPKASKRIKEIQQAANIHTTRPDLSNLIKYIEDVLVDANILSDDKVIHTIVANKKYSQNPQTKVEILCH